jgi:peroxiredoxin
VDVVHLLGWLYEEALSGQSCADEIANAHDHLQNEQMAQESLQSIPLGTPASEFSLPDVVTGKVLSLSSLPPFRGLLVMFICRHCPYVIHVRDEILRIARDYKSKGISFVAICSNDAAAYPDDAPDKLREMAQENAFPFPLLYDETQAVAKAYQAQCTPDFYLYNSQKLLAYHGRLDESTPGNRLPLTGRDLRLALDAVLGDEECSGIQKPSVGCSIKWKAA